MYNEYENEKFFQEYAKMPRSQDGLDSAGEWRQLKPLFPRLQGKKFLIWDVVMAGIVNLQRNREHHKY